MASELDLAAAEEAPADPGRSLRFWVSLVSLVAVLVLSAVLLGPVFILFTVIVLAGVGLTCHSGIALSLAERVAFGTVIGAVAVTLASFLSSLAFGFSGPSVGLGFAVAMLAGGAGAWSHRGRLLVDLDAAVERWTGPVSAPDHPWPLLLLLGACWSYWLVFMTRAYALKGDGSLYAGYVNIWGDWAAHLTYAGSFAYGHNLPPQMPIDPGNHLGYPFMMDFLAAILTLGGAGLTTSLELTSGLLGMAFPAVMYLVARRFIRDRLAAVLAVAVFLLSGGIGFWYLIGDLRQGGLQLLQTLPREYTLERPHLNDQWLNPVLAYLVPQRSTLFGFSLALIIPAILYLAARGSSWRPFIFCGLIAGVMPWFHVHAFGTVVALGGIWFLIHRRRQWLGFLLPAIAIGVPSVLWLLPPSHDLRFQFGWMAGMDGHHDNVLWFWFVNLGLFIPTLVVAQFWPRPATDQPEGPDFRVHFAPMWLWFLVPNFVLLAMWEWDNTKFFVFWCLFGSILVGGFLAHLFRRGWAPALLAAVLLVTLTLAGGADLLRATNTQINSYQFTDAAGLRAATWVRGNTDPRAVILDASEHNEPVTVFAGRPVVVGFVGWLWSYGLTDWYPKQQDALAMLRGEPQTPALVSRYRVAYVVIGPLEIQPAYGANLYYWETHATQVYSDGEYSIFKI